MRRRRLLLFGVIVLATSPTPVLAMPTPAAANSATERKLDLQGRFVRLPLSRTIGHPTSRASAVTRRNPALVYPSPRAPTPPRATGTRTSAYLAFSAPGWVYQGAPGPDPFLITDQAGQGVAEDQEVNPSWPPDPAFAASTTNAVEVVNGQLRLYTHTLSQLDSYDLKSWWCTQIAGTPPAACSDTNVVATDPRIAWDSGSQRFFSTIMFWNTATNDSAVNLAVSQTSDPTGLWSVYTVVQSTGLEHDQPKLGVTTDKVTITTNDLGNAPFGSFSNEQMWVIQKSDVVGLASSAASVDFNLTGTRFNVVPAQTLSSSSDQYAVYVDEVTLVGGTYPTYLAGTQGYAGVLTISGTPSGGGVSILESLYAYGNGNVNPPPAAVQPAPGRPLDDGNNELPEYQSAAWQSGILVMAGNDNCTVAQNNASCIRYDALNTTNGAFIQDLAIACSNCAYFDPGISLDTSGYVYLDFTATSASLAPQALAFGNPGNVLGSSAVMYGFASSSGPYDCGTGCSQQNRWGDYQTVVQDPAAGDVWFVGEYSLGGSTASNDWGTELFEAYLYG